MSDTSCCVRHIIRNSQALEKEGTNRDYAEKECSCICHMKEMSVMLCIRVSSYVI